MLQIELFKDHDALGSIAYLKSSIKMQLTTTIAMVVERNLGDSSTKFFLLYFTYEINNKINIF